MDKTIIIGNSPNILDKKREIDNKYDIIVRINLGIPKGKEKYIGSRTDILAISTVLKLSQIEQFNPNKIIYLSPRNRDKIGGFIEYIDDFYPLDYWIDLVYKLNARPSTGCMIIDWVYRDYTKDISLIGFDFWESKKSWCYESPRKEVPHNYKKEKEYVKSLGVNIL